MPAIASIPSPSSPTIDLGPLSLRVYGILLAVGVVVAAKIAERRWARTGRDAHELAAIWLAVVIAGVVGARLYHVVTDYQRFEGHWFRAFEVWKGGLSIWGAVIGGAAAVVVMTRRRGLDTLVALDAIAPGVLVAQALGRWGNWFNQELFGKPTDLPWALEIDPAHRPAGYLREPTFHPTFLYESLFCLLLAGALVATARRLSLARGQVCALYVSLYSFGRFFFEILRIDPAHELVGMRVNAWVSIATFVVGAGWFVWLGRRASAEPLRAQVGREHRENGAGGIA